MHKHLLLTVFVSAVIVMGCQGKKEATSMSPLGLKIQRFTPTEITGDTSRLSEGDRRALSVLVDAARVMDKLYIRQVWSGNEALLKQLQQDTSPEGRERLHYFFLNMGPWSKLDHDEPFIAGVPDHRPPNANYYPDDMTKEEFNSWVSSLAEPAQRNARGFFYTIRRDPDRHLIAVPYSEEYHDPLVQAAELLRKAAGLTDNGTLKTFLEKRASAFLSNDYFDSDVAWMDLDSPIDVTIGPYEVYMDELFNYKAAFEAYITLRDDAETAKLGLFSQHLQEIEDNLPIDKRFRNPKLGAMAPIRVVDEVFTGGEARAGVQTAAFNLPNDERVTAEKGSKRVMLKNVQEAKFDKILIPIARLTIDPMQQRLVSFNEFFTHILAHELMHGLGPHTITLHGRQTTVRQEMKDLGSALEEAKADISGLFALQLLMDRGIVQKNAEQSLYVTYLASAFRSVRFGINEAHGRGVAMQFNYLTDRGAFIYDESTGTFRVDFGKIKDAVRQLTGEIMTIQAEGDYARAKAFLDTHAVIRTPMARAIERLASVPVDIEPQFGLGQ